MKQSSSDREATRERGVRGGRPAPRKTWRAAFRLQSDFFTWGEIAVAGLR
jgi:hypothetical protein